MPSWQFYMQQSFLRQLIFTQKIYNIKPLLWITTFRNNANKSVQVPILSYQALYLPCIDLIFPSVKALLHYALIHLRFYFSHVFARVMTRVFDTNMLVSKTRVKTREKSKTRAQRETMFLYYTMRWVKTRVSCVFLAFLFTNANQKHSVIGA